MDVLLGERRKALWPRPPSNLCMGNYGARWSLFLLITMGGQITKDTWCQKLHKYPQAYHSLYPELWLAFKQAFCQGFIQNHTGKSFCRLAIYVCFLIPARAEEFPSVLLMFLTAIRAVLHIHMHACKIKARVRSPLYPKEEPFLP